MNLDGEPSTVYLEGFVIADFTEGQTDRTVKLEVGRHAIEIWNAQTLQVMYRGVVQVEKGYTLLVEFSHTQAPQAPARRRLGPSP